MWWEYAIVGSAVLLSTAWLVRRFTKTRKGACDGCGPHRRPARLQSEIPVLDLDRPS